MAIVTSAEMFKKAYDGGYAIGAFNVNNMEIIQGITEAAMEKRAPLILQVSKGASAYAKHVYLMNLIRAAIEDAEQSAGFDLPIVVHLDHGDSFELCKSCIDGGFTSVMIDKSGEPFEKNIEITKQVVEYAHDHGVVVEAELGTLAGVEDEVKVSAEDSSYTRPEDVQEFVERTGCDSLAIAIGTSHGAYKFTAAQCTRNADGLLVPPPLRFDAGVFEFDNFIGGSKAIADAIAKATANGAFSLIGGGDSVACINKFGMADQVSYISTGGGALLEAIEGKVLPGVAAIKGE